MATREEIIKRAKETIIAYPSAGKTKINTYLVLEFGVGLRSSKILELKKEVARDNPILAPELYKTGGSRKGYNDVYKAWKDAGFTPYEARELTLGNGRLSKQGAKKVLNSAPGKAARKVREKWVKDRLKDGWTKKEIKAQILRDYQNRLGKLDKHGKPFSPWSAIRDEYKPKPKVTKQQYKDMTEKRKAKRAKRQAKRRE